MSTGKTHVGGPAQVHELTRLTISKLAVGPMDNNCYLLRCRETGDQLLIDAAAEPERILDLIGPDGLTTIVTTHAHPDHWVALAEVRKQTGATSVAHEVDAEHLAELVDRTVVDGDTITVGQVALRVIHLVGHTPDRSPCSTTIRWDNRTCSPATVYFQVAWAKPGAQRTSTPCWPVSRSGSSTPFPMKRGCIPVMGTTPRLGPSARR